jgi:hypothetical protein
MALMAGKISGCTDRLRAQAEENSVILTAGTRSATILSKYDYGTFA